MKKLFGFIFMIMMLLSFSQVSFAAENLYSASVEGELSLHISPGDNSYVVTKIPACSKLKLLKTERTWGLVEFQNKSGWINLSFTRSSYSKAAEATGNDSAKRIKVNSEDKKAVLYNVPSADAFLGSEEKFRIPNETILEITRETASGWGLVSMNGKYAWIQMKDTAVYQEEDDADRYGIYYVYVLSNEGMGLEMWEKTDKKNLCAVIPDCIKLTVREVKGDLAYVSYDGLNGWIELKYTTESLANAQSNAGTAVNIEHTVIADENTESVNMLSVPSEKEADGGSVVASVKKGEAVFVMRSTLGGWSLINYEGNLGWLPPGSVEIAPEGETNIIEVPGEPRTAYVKTAEKKGMKLFSEFNGETLVATVPECTEIKVVAQKDGYEYVFCNYASGWALQNEYTENRDEVYEADFSGKKSYYITKTETPLMSIPTGNELCGTQELKLLGKDTYFEAVKIVTTANKKWALVKTDDMTGWVKLADAKEAATPVAIILLIVLAAGIVGVLTFFAVRIIMKKKKENTKKEVEKNETDISVEGGGTGEKSSDVPCER